jgi:hypothetical protein
MIQNKIVARYQDGRMIKGSTNDFMPNKEIFHVVPADSPPGTKPIDVFVKDLKAVFFVKDLVGKGHSEGKKDFDPSIPVAGRKIKVVFRDGETMIGMTQGYQPSRPGFFVVLPDPNSNNDRCFVVTAATTEVTFI